VRHRGDIGRAGIAVLLAAASVVLVASFAPRHGFFDLKVYYGAINFWAHGDGEVYDYLAPPTKYGFTYPPFAALVMLPVALLPWNAAIAVSLAGTAAATAAVTWWFLGPVVAARGWSRWFVVAVAAALLFAFEPMRETLSFGQVNMLLVFVVVTDLLWFVGRRPWGGVGVGLATAVKLTPGIFILYLLLVRRYRAAVVATATTAVATLAAAAAAPHASRIFWTDALWDTDRIGSMSYISNQSIEGFVARLHPAAPNMRLWAGLVLVVLAGWVWQVRRAVRRGDEVAGLALTGVVGCLISPVTWVHHLVWLLPALLLLTARGLAALATDLRRAIPLLVLAGGLYALLCSRLVWLYADRFTGWGLLFGNAYAVASLVLLAGLPLADPAPRPAAPVDAGFALAAAAGSAHRAGVADFVQADDAAVRPAYRKG
jgi:alpha-1,2-mannosyltransferase